MTEGCSGGYKYQIPKDVESWTKLVVDAVAMWLVGKTADFLERRWRPQIPRTHNDIVFRYRLRCSTGCKFRLTFKTSNEFKIGQSSSPSLIRNFNPRSKIFRNPNLVRVEERPVTCRAQEMHMSR